MKKTFNIIVLGGTFDHLHKGHKEFIRFAFSLADKVFVCITSDEYVKNSKFKTLNSKLIESYEKREKVLEDFLKAEEVFQGARIVKIDDVFGITIDTDFKGEAIVVVEKTLSGAKKINEKRKAMDFLPLEIIKAPLEKADDAGFISSSRIRAGEIDRNGKLYINPLWKKHELYIPDKLREEFKEPFGELIGEDYQTFDNKFLITVGDVTTQRFNKLALEQEISVIDLKVSRKKIFTKVEDLGFSGKEEIVNVVNPPGTLTPQLFNAIVAAFKVVRKRVIIQIEGEDDLAVLPLILAAPLGVNIFYGQPDKGIVKVGVDEEIKEKAYNLVEAFNTRGYAEDEIHRLHF